MGSNKKLTVPIVYVMPQAHVRVWPRTKGDGRLRARAAANSWATVAYSSVRCAPQKASISLVISSNRGLTIFGTA